MPCAISALVHHNCWISLAGTVRVFEIGRRHLLVIFQDLSSRSDAILFSLRNPFPGMFSLHGYLLRRVVRHGHFSIAANPSMCKS